MSDSSSFTDRRPARLAALFPIGTAVAEAGRLPRDYCPTCGRNVALRRGGQLREHRIREGQHNPLCEAKGSTPAELREIARQRDIDDRRRAGYVR